VRRLSGRGRRVACAPSRAESLDSRRTPLRPAQAQVLALHDGRWWVADALDLVKSRDDGHWWVVVRFTTDPGSTYVLAMPAERCQAV
jgi:hypothetical protein